MRIACYGFVERGVGSVAGANFLLLEELLRSGHEIDFYAIRGFVQPRELFDYPNFRYLGIDNRYEQRLSRLPNPIKRTLDPVLNLAFYRLCMRDLSRLLGSEKARRDYELALFLGIPAQFRVTGLPVVSWVQGPPQTEWQAIARNRDTIVKLCGARLYYLLKVYYAYKSVIARRELGNSGHVICGSEWSRQQIIDYGFRASDVSALPYPVDTDFFRPAAPASAPDKRTFLWLGRIDPRKRLDLLMDAFTVLLKRRPDVRLLIVGGFPYAAGYRKLIDGFEPRAAIEYRPFVPRPEVAGLLDEIDVLIQPSESENFGSSVAEALCSGKPVITGPTNGTGEYAGDMTFAFHEYTPESVAEAMDRSLAALESDPDEISARCRQIGLDQFAIPVVTSKLEEIMRTAVQNWQLDRAASHARLQPSTR